MLRWLNLSLLIVYDGTKSKNILKIDYIPLEKTIIDMSKSLSEYEAAGWKV